jgi:hypothetical protein
MDSKDNQVAKRTDSLRSDHSRESVVESAFTRGDVDAPALRTFPTILHVMFGLILLFPYVLEIATPKFSVDCPTLDYHAFDYLHGRAEGSAVDDIPQNINVNIIFALMNSGKSDALADKIIAGIEIGALNLFLKNASLISADITVQRIPVTSDSSPYKTNSADNCVDIDLSSVLESDSMDRWASELSSGIHTGRSSDVNIVVYLPYSVNGARPACPGSSSRILYGGVIDEMFSLLVIADLSEVKLQEVLGSAVSALRHFCRAKLHLPLPRAAHSNEYNSVLLSPEEENRLQYVRTQILWKRIIENVHTYCDLKRRNHFLLSERISISHFNEAVAILMDLQLRFQSRCGDIVRSESDDQCSNMMDRMSKANELVDTLLQSINEVELFDLPVDQLTAVFAPFWIPLLVPLLKGVLKKNP